MKTTVVEMEGKRFGMLTVLERAGTDKHRTAHWLCLCDCGITKRISGKNIRRGTSKSCGCTRGTHTKHGCSRVGQETVEYTTWKNMLARCYNKNRAQYKNWGGRGIKVCPEWRHNFNQFLSDMGPKPSGLTLERVDNNAGYGPDNCKWATTQEQNSNKRSYQERRP